ncbi:MAG: hypothetical protein ACTSU5_01600 [Promethearchaeota archaeon]
MENAPLCSICHQPVGNPQNMATCPNGHPVHGVPCLKKWYTSNGFRGVCPVCSEQYDPAFYGPWFEQVKEEHTNRLKQEEMERKLAEYGNIQRQVEAKDKLRRDLEEVEGALKRRDFKGVVDLAYEVLDEHPNQPDALFLLGKAFYKMGKLALAVNNLMKLVKVEHNYPLGFYMLAKTYEKLGMGDKAKWALDRSVHTREKWGQVNTLLFEDSKFADYEFKIKKKLADSQSTA